MSKPIYDELKDTGSELKQVLSSFAQEDINKVPFAGSWTAGQVAEHVLKSASGVLANVNSDVQPTERNPEEHVKMLSDAFLNFEIKMKSPDFILPTDEPKEKTTLLNSLSHTINNLEQAARTEDLSATCTAFEMPTVGALTRIEWLSFANVHTLRHIHQLKNIKQAIDQHKN
ncbi:MAG TPA: DinB family protein [Mucilaginibacter sp.]|nr:DinB family protein [Mucilaginibacter sp.]